MAKFDMYTIRARFYPGIISALPILVLGYFLFPFEDFKNLLSFLLSLQFAGSITISVVFLYFYSQIIRMTSKHFTDKYFCKEKGLPTTYYMMFNDSHYSKEFKTRFREKIMNKFNFSLLNEEQEGKQKKEAKKRLDETIEMVRVNLDDRLLLKKHEIWYGFFRNLISGSIFGAIFSLLNIILGFFVFKNLVLIIVSAVLIVFYCLYFCQHRTFLFRAAEEYARRLLAEFMSQ